MAGVITWTLLILAAVAFAAVCFEALRRGILWRMAARNAARRPRQTATVIAGLMVGTAIISAALVAGDSAGSAIRGAVYDALGPVDETVRLDAFNYYTDDVLDAYLDDPAITGWFDGISPNAIWDVSLTNPRTDLFEPQVAAVGYDAEMEAAFRPFELVAGDFDAVWDGRGLPADGAVLTQELADLVEAEVGDMVELRFTPPKDPLIPDITPLQGTLLVSAGGGLLSPIITDLVGIPDPMPIVSQTQTFEVEDGASAIIVVLGWDPRIAPALPPTTSMHLRLEAPSGAVYEAGSLLDPLGPDLPPLWLNVTPDPPPVEVGTWSLSVSSSLAINAPYAGAALVLYPIYDSTELQKRARELQDADLGPFEDLVDLGPFAQPKTLGLRVDAITDGGRGDQFDFGTAVWMDMATAQDAWDRDDQINVIKFSNPGGVVGGRDSTDEAVARLNATLTAIKAQYPHDPAVQELIVRPVKDDFVQLADDSGQLMTALLLFAGSLSVITGLLLIINIFTMLAEERRSELGMARAVGMSRGDLVRLFLFEGSLYAVAAAALGAILGVGLAAILVAVLNAILSGLSGGFPPIALIVTWDSVLVAFAIGVLLTFATILVASRRIARLNIVRAIRRIEDPEKAGTTFQFNLGIGLGLLGAAGVAIGWLVSGFQYHFSLQVFGALLLAIGTGLALKRWVRRRILHTTLAGALAAYYTMTYFVITKYDNISEANVVGPVRGVILTLCIVVMVVYFQAGPRLLGRLLSSARRLRAVAVPAFSYPQHKRFRTGMTLAMFSIVILSIGFFSIFGGLFDQPADRQTGGFDIEASTTLEVEDLAVYDRGLIPDGLISAEVRVDDFFTPDVSLVTVEGERTGQFSARVGHHVFGIDEDFVAAQDFRLLWRLDEYASDDDAYQALLDQDDVVIVAYPYSTNELNQDLSHEVGETLQIHVGDVPEEFTIIGIQEQYHFTGIFLSADRMAGLFPTTVESFYLYKIPADQDAVEAAKLLEQNYRDVGMNAESTVENVQEEQEAFRQILGAMKLFLGLGLIVGVLSLGIVTARSVIERRQEIGMLRALGYTPNMVRRIFFIEVTFVVVLGAAIGIACSIIVSFGLWYSIIRELQYPYVIPWVEILLLLGVSYVVALAATIAPIRRAAKVAPAEALRYIE